MLLPAALLGAQPDLVAAAELLLVSIAVLASSRRTRIPAILLGAVALAAPLLCWRFLLHGYQKERILDFLRDAPDPLGAGYQAAVAGDLLRAAALALAALLVAACVRVALGAQDRFASRLALGCGLLLAWQAGLHAAVNLGLLPVVGTPGFPLVSYGGSGTVAAFVCVGLACRAAIDARR